MTTTTPLDRSGPAPGEGATLEVDLFAVALELAALVDATAAAALDAAEVDLAVAARGQVLALARALLEGVGHVEHDWLARPAMAPGAVAAVVDQVVAGIEVPLAVAARQAVTDEQRAWVALSQRAGEARARWARTVDPGASTTRWAALAGGVRLAALITAVDRRLLCAARALPDPDAAQVAALERAVRADAIALDQHTVALAGAPAAA